MSPAEEQCEAVTPTGQCTKRWGHRGTHERHPACLRADQAVDAEREEDIRAIGEAMLRAGASVLLLWEGLTDFAEAFRHAVVREAARARRGDA